ncbi:MAG: DUF6279 family lipoprotein [Oligoflexus sp.]
MTRLLHFSLIAFLLSSCTFQGLVYRNIDWLATRRVNKMFDLNREQQRSFDPEIRRLVNEVKVIAVGGGIEVLGELQKVTADDEFSKDDFLAVEKKLFRLYQQIVRHIVDDTARFYKALEDQQLEHFQEKLAEGPKWLSSLAEADDKSFPKELRKSLAKSQERYESWLGPLTKQQMEVQKESWPSSPEEAQAWLDDRHKQHAAFVQIVRKNSEEEFKKSLLAWAEDPKWLRQQAELGEDPRDFREFIFRLRETFTPEQVQFLHKRAGELIKDLRSLES